MMAFITTQRTLLALLSLYSLLITTTAFHVHSPSPPSAIDTHNIHNPIAGPLGVRPRQAQKPRLSTNGRCGPQTAAGWRCPATVEEQAIIDGKGETPELKSLELKCCSAQGYCGGTGEHCGAGCQPNYGICTAAPNRDTTSDLTCGPANKNRKCPAPEQCCSANGYCGTGADYCQSPQCLRGFGWCDADSTPKGRNTSWVDRSGSGRPGGGVGIVVDGREVDYGVNIYKCNNPGHVALTYDDGPYNFTGELLDILDEFGIKATFFVTGVNKGKGAIDDPRYGWDKIIRRMYRSGHQIASHTWSHADLDALNEWDRRNEMIKLEMSLRNILGLIPTYMRPPYSSCSTRTGCLATMRALGYYVVNFSLDTQDYFHPLPAQIQVSKDIFARALHASTPAAGDSHLVIAHDIVKQTAVNLTRSMARGIREGGWRGVTVGECLGGGGGGVGGGEAGWYRVAESEAERRERVGREEGGAVGGTGEEGDGNGKVTEGESSSSVMGGLNVTVPVTETETETETAGSVETLGSGMGTQTSIANSTPTSNTGTSIGSSDGVQSWGRRTGNLGLYVVVLLSLAVGVLGQLGLGI